MTGLLSTLKLLTPEKRLEKENLKLNEKKAVNILNGLSIIKLERLHVPKAFGKEVWRSTPLYSTTYVLRLYLFSNKLNKFYIGYSENLQKRLAEHNAGMSKFTSMANDWIIVYSEAFNSRKDARKRELEIKRKKSRKYIEWLIHNKS
jgi:putative endonuclease